MNDESLRIRGAGRSNGRGLLAIGATYTYFLLFAQFGFLKVLKEYHPDPLSVRDVMGAMGLSGLIASGVAAFLLARIQPGKLLRIAFLGCALAAVATLGCRRLVSFMAVGGAIGASTGVLTVTLAASVRRLIRGEGVGLKLGIATGAAYFVCNIPMLFEGPGWLQAVVSAGLCLAGWLATPGRLDEGPGEAPSAISVTHYTRWGVAGVVVGFLALVWLDSAAFAIIQQNIELKGQTWSTPWQKMMMGSWHFLGAVLAGALLDRGRFVSLLALTYGLFVLAFTHLGSGEGWPIAGSLYAVGISIYSVALVYYPSAQPETAGRVPIRFRAAGVYAVAGWLGSALGVGMAQNLHVIPVPFLWLAGGLIGLNFMARYGGGFPVRRLASLSLPVMVGVGMFFTVPGRDHLGPLHGAANPATRGEDLPAGPAAESVARGRQVYIREGCINCHSQFIRPHTRDVEWWGPFRPVDRTEAPPLIGNRRQGPDLLNVGNRRSSEWQRLHLREPRAVSPGSSMPSYAYLFEAGSPEGDDLVAYLNSLGAGTLAERAADQAEWLPVPNARTSSPERGHRLYAQSCAQCHGQDGQGDGPVSSLLVKPARNLRGPLQFVPNALPVELKLPLLARLIKFGVPGTSMPGHEYFRDQDIMDVAGYVMSMSAAPP